MLKIFPACNGSRGSKLVPDNENRSFSNFVATQAVVDSSSLYGP